MQPDQVLAKIFKTYMNLPEDRVIIYNGNFDAPKDPHIYILISYVSGQVLGVKNEFDPVERIETASAVTYNTYAVEIVSKSREAMERKEEILMALHSQIGLDIAEMYNIRLWRSGNILDLSAIEGASALSRYRINIVISSLKEKEMPIDVYEHFPQEGVYL